MLAGTVWLTRMSPFCPADAALGASLLLSVNLFRTHVAPAAFGFFSCSSHVFAHFAHNFRVCDLPGIFRVAVACLGHSLNCGPCFASSGRKILDGHLHYSLREDYTVHEGQIGKHEGEEELVDGTSRRVYIGRWSRSSRYSSKPRMQLQ